MLKLTLVQKFGFELGFRRSKKTLMSVNFRGRFGRRGLQRAPAGRVRGNEAPNDGPGQRRKVKGRRKGGGKGRQRGRRPTQVSVNQIRIIPSGAANFYQKLDSKG